jgi:hypothetical protein
MDWLGTGLVDFLGGLQGKDLNKSSNGGSHYQSSSAGEVAAEATRSGGGGQGPTRSRQIDLFMEESRTSESAACGSAPHHHWDRERPRDRDNRDNRDNRDFARFAESDTGTGTSMDKGSFDNGDGTTTNLYVGNLSPATTEEQLTALFERYGHIRSVKIMWPRSDEERVRKRNCGFVSFQLREDADSARVDLQEYVLNGYKMIVGWGKAPRPAVSAVAAPPITILTMPTTTTTTTTTAATTTTVVESSGLEGSGGRVLVGSDGNADTNLSWSMDRDTVPVAANERSAHIAIVVPSDERLRAIVDLAAQYVATDGEQFEQVSNLFCCFCCRH